MTFGEMVRQERKALNLTQQELADAVHVSKMTIRRIEGISTDAEIKTIKLETLIAVSNVLKSYAIWSLAVGGYGLTENDPDIGPTYLTIETLQREYGFTASQIQRKMMVDYAYVDLNDGGQQKVFEYVIDISGNPKYTKPNEQGE